MFRFVPVIILSILSLAGAAIGQWSNSPDKTEALPKTMRGYKVQRAQIEVKKTNNADKDSDEQVGEILLRLGDAKLVDAGPLGVTFEVPVVLAAVKQEGDVDRLVFDHLRVNDIVVKLEDYDHPFKLPNKEALTLLPPLKIFVSTPQALLRTVDEIFNSKEVWRVTGRIYVCGHFRKLLLKFKRAVPIDIETTINNPLK